MMSASLPSRYTNCYTKFSSILEVPTPKETQPLPSISLLMSWSSGMSWNCSEPPFLFCEISLSIPSSQCGSESEIRQPKMCRVPCAQETLEASFPILRVSIVITATLQQKALNQNLQSVPKEIRPTGMGCFLYLGSSKNDHLSCNMSFLSLFLYVAWQLAVLGRSVLIIMMLKPHTGSNDRSCASLGYSK